MYQRCGKDLCYLHSKLHLADCIAWRHSILDRAKLILCHLFAGKQLRPSPDALLNTLPGVGLSPSIASVSCCLRASSSADCAPHCARCSAHCFASASLSALSWPTSPACASCAMASLLCSSDMEHCAHRQTTAILSTSADNQLLYAVMSILMHKSKVSWCISRIVTKGV